MQIYGWDLFLSEIYGLSSFTYDMKCVSVLIEFREDTNNSIDEY